MRKRLLPFLLLASMLGIAAAEEAAPRTKPQYVEVVDDAPRLRYLHLKSALAHLEQAGAIEAADIVRKLLAAEKREESSKVVTVEMTVYEIDQLKLRDHGLKDGIDWWLRIAGQNSQSRPDKVAADLKDLARQGIIAIISEPELQTQSGVEATVSVGNESRRMTSKVLPTVVDGKKVRVQVAFSLTTSPPPQKEGEPVGAARPAEPSIGLTTTVETNSGKPIVIAGTKAIKAGKAGKKDPGNFVFVLTPTIVTKPAAGANNVDPSGEVKQARKPAAAGTK